MRRFTCLVALALGSCTFTAPKRADELPDSLRRFEALARFLPAGMQSYCFTDNPRLAEALGERSSRGEVLWTGECGADFEPPVDIGVGRFRSVAVYDYGLGNAPPAPGEQATATDVAIDALPVWHAVDERSGQERWIAVVDARFHVEASSRGLLARALRRDRTLRDALAFVPDLSVLRDDSVSVLACRPRPQPRTMFAGPSPTAVTLAESHPATNELRLFSTAAQADLVTYFGRYAEATERSRVGAYQVATLRGVEFAWSYFLFALLFGKQIFI